MSAFRHFIHGWHLPFFHSRFEMRFGVKFAKDLNFAMLGKGRISRQIQLHKDTKEIYLFLYTWP